MSLEQLTPECYDEINSANFLLEHVILEWNVKHAAQVYDLTEY